MFLLSFQEGEAKACHFLGYAHYCLGNYKEATRYFYPSAKSI